MLVFLSGRGVSVPNSFETVRRARLELTRTSISERLLSTRASRFHIASTLFCKHNIAGNSEMAMKGVHECLLYMLLAEE